MALGRISWGAGRGWTSDEGHQSVQSIWGGQAGADRAGAAKQVWLPGWPERRRSKDHNVSPHLWETSSKSLQSHSFLPHFAKSCDMPRFLTLLLCWSAFLAAVHRNSPSSGPGEYKAPFPEAVVPDEWCPICLYGLPDYVWMKPSSHPWSNVWILWFLLQT